MIRKTFAAVAIMGSLMLSACFHSPSNGSKESNGFGDVQIILPKVDNQALAKVSANQSALKLVISGEEMDPIERQWSLSSAPETISIKVPAGQNRQFIATLLNRSGEATHEGKTLAHVKARVKTHVFIYLKLIKGSVEVCIDVEGMERECDTGNPNENDIITKMPGFESIKLRLLLSSASKLPLSPDFVFGSMTDGAGLLAESDGSFTLINNLEADYSIARIQMDEAMNPISGEYILNATATANTAQCSGTLITQGEHGFGPLWLSGGEWGGSSNGVFATDPYRDANSAETGKLLTAMGQWTVENAVPIGKEAYPGKTVVFIGDDQSNNSIPSGQLGMYVGNQGDLEGGKLYGLKVTASGVNYEMDMQEGESYSAEFVELAEKELNAIDAECKAKGVMGFSRLEDIDWRRGSAANNRQIYFAVTGRKNSGLLGKGTFYGRIYKVTLNETNPTGAATIECVLDGDILDGKAKAFHSPDNIVVTENYAYIQEDPNGYPDTPEKAHFCRVYQYNLNTGDFKAVFEANQTAAEALGIGSASNNWEFTGMVDVSDVVGTVGSFLLGVQAHGWENEGFTDPKANPDLSSSSKEGSFLFLVNGLPR